MATTQPSESRAPRKRAYFYMVETTTRTEGQKTLNEKNGGNSDTFNFDVSNCMDIISDSLGMNKEAIEWNVYGTNMDSDEFSRHRFRVHWGEIENGREKQVDTRLAVDMVAKAVKLYCRLEAVDFVIIPGNAYMNPVLQTAMDFGHTVHVWSWERALSEKYLELQAHPSYGDHLTITKLDGFLERLHKRPSQEAPDQP
ncbi:hypothetical protein F53441_12001 [Fusarium austroafricanum]|uniref:NYN domain-containing protein n=1 Tax=Fusarium austroafricanum TaxID=2364996 RepID=A0A8H4K170_9HYPO|nr:hypothetical protein F53441_12001 [Fusarium austroafricanum]